MRKRAVAVGIILCLLISTLVSCNTSANQGGDTKDKAQEQKIEIGFIFDSFIIERWQRDRDAFTAVAKNEYGAEVDIQNANGDVEEQKTLIEYFIRKKVDVLVIVPIDSDAITEEVKRARNQGIKVIAYDRLIKNANVDLYLSFDNEMVGTLMGKELKKHLKDGGDVFMMCGPKGDNNVTLAEQGFLKEVEDSNLHIVEKEYASGWMAESGYEYLSTYLEHHSNIDGIMCGNDAIAGQVIHALSEHRLSGNVYVVGQDADLDACQRIVEGTQTMTVYKQVTRLAELAACYAVLLAKQQHPTGVQTMFDGTYDVPYIGLSPIAITDTNMDLVIQDGFHLKEDIYLNIK